MTDNWLDQFGEREVSTPVPDIVQPQFLSQQPGFMDGQALDILAQFSGIGQENQSPAWVNSFDGGQHNQGGTPHFVHNQQAWTNNLGGGQANQRLEDNREQQQSTWTNNLGSARRALREKAAQGDTNKHRARREGAVRTGSMESGSDSAGNWTSTSVSSQSSSSSIVSCSSYSPPQPTEEKKKRKKKKGEKKRKLRPCEQAEQEMNGKKRRLAPPMDVTEEDLHDESDERMVQMTMTTYMKLISKVAEPKGIRTIGMVQPGAFKRLAQKGDMTDVWTECLLCGAREATKTRMKAHYEAHLPTRNPMALLLGVCEKIGQLALGSKTMASEESQQASYRMSHSLWKHYGTMLSGRGD